MSNNLSKKALILSYFTVGYNILEGIVSVVAGILAGSIALTGFGMDSFIESLSGGIMIWRFSKYGKLTEDEEQKIETRAVTLIGYTFFIFGIYVLYESFSKLYFREKPDPTIIGIIIGIVSTVVMPVLFYLKYKTGKSLNSKSLIADSKETLTCVFLSISLLIGLGLNYLYNLWWADPAVGILIVIFLFREGFETLKEGID
ncbi:MAG: cation transporter [Candidatus Latescibacteria bacterium]|nr:cation transporter [Candidatus Latescibacterota bacterium]